MSETPIFKFRLVAENTTESGKAASANENALITEALFKGRVESRSTTAPPGSPANADTYIVPDTGATGAWVGHDDEIAIYYNGWLFVAPVNGPVFYVADEDLYVKYDDTASPPVWIEKPPKAGSVTFATSGTASVSFGTAEPDASYFVAISGNANETFWVTGKGTGGFTVNSSNASSTATVDWILVR